MIDSLTAHYPPNVTGQPGLLGWYSGDQFMPLHWNSDTREIDDTSGNRYWVGPTRAGVDLNYTASLDLSTF